MNEIDLDSVDASDEAKDLMEKLLQIIVELRLGGGPEDS
jgi:hypothetical protein